MTFERFVLWLWIGNREFDTHTHTHTCVTEASVRLVFVNNVPVRVISRTPFAHCFTQRNSNSRFVQVGGGDAKLCLKDKLPPTTWLGTLSFSKTLYKGQCLLTANHSHFAPQSDSSELNFTICWILFCSLCFVTRELKIEDGTYCISETCFRNTCKEESLDKLQKKSKILADGHRVLGRCTILWYIHCCPKDEQIRLCGGSCYYKDTERWQKVWTLSSRLKQLETSPFGGSASISLLSILVTFPIGHLLIIRLDYQLKEWNSIRISSMLDHRHYPQALICIWLYTPPFFRLIFIYTKSCIVYSAIVLIPL